MKKGFTLVELLVVIVILGLISLVVYPAVIGIISDMRNSAYESQTKIIVKAAKEWGFENVSKLPEKDNTCTVNIFTLTSNGYIEQENLKNPKGGLMDGCVEISFESNQYVYTYIDEQTLCTNEC